MRKILLSFLIIGLGIIVTAFFLVIGIKNVTDYSINLVVGEFPTSGVLFLVDAGISWIIFLFLIQRNRRKTSEITVNLLIYFLFTAIAMTSQGFFDTWGFNNLSLNLYGTQMNYLWISESIIIMAYFIFEIFKNGIDQGDNKRWFLVLATIAVGFDFFMALDIFLPLQNYQLILLGVILYVVILTIFTSLGRSAFYLAGRVREEDKVSSTAFRFMGTAGYVLLIAYVMLFVYIILKAVMGSMPEFEPLDHASIIICGVGYVILFMGFLYPTIKNKGR